MMQRNRNDAVWLLLLLALGGPACQHSAKRTPPARATPDRPLSSRDLSGAVQPHAESLRQSGEIRRFPLTEPISRPLGDRQCPVVPVGYQAEASNGYLPPLAAAIEAAEDSTNSATAAETLPAPEPRPPAASTADLLSLDEVVQSVYLSFPLLEVELRQRQVADGEALSAWGPYDLNVEAYGIAAPEGFYENYRSGVALKQAHYTGGYAYGGYRIGRGEIQPWFKERLTDEGGEFKVGLGVPLLQNRRIDKYRSQVLQTSIAREAVEPGIQSQLLGFVLAASDAYWNWVAAGQTLQAQEEMLRLATTRVQQIEDRVQSGDLERIARIDNQRLVATRQTKLIEAERKFQAAAIKLSLFLRDESGAPTLAPLERLPPEFPKLSTVAAEAIDGDIALAQSLRPELQVLDLLAEQVNVELLAAENQLLPKLDARLEASKDVGARADPKGDKTPFELEAGVWGELPLQRREARGKMQSLHGKAAQIAAKRRFTADKVAAEVRDAVSALVAAAERIEQTRISVQLAEQGLDLGREAFDAGDLTIVTLNIYEQAVLDARVQRIEAEVDYFQAMAAYAAAMGGMPPAAGR